jgi:hypothetical protein
MLGERSVPDKPGTDPRRIIVRTENRRIGTVEAGPQAYEEDLLRNVESAVLYRYVRGAEKAMRKAVAYRNTANR